MSQTRTSKPRTAQRNSRQNSEKQRRPFDGQNRLTLDEDVDAILELEASVIEEFRPESAYDQRLVRNISELDREFDQARRRRENLFATACRNAVWDEVTDILGTMTGNDRKAIWEQSNRWAFGVPAERAQAERDFKAIGVVLEEMLNRAYVACESQLAELDKQIARLEGRRRRAWTDIEERQKKRRNRKALAESGGGAS